MSTRSLRWAVLVAAVLLLAVVPQRAAAEQLGMTCDAFVIAPNGTIGTTPVASNLQFGTVASVTTPASARPGEVFTVSVLSEALPGLVSEAAGFPVLSHRAFIRVFHVTGATVVPDSAHNSPPTDATAATTSATLTLGLATKAPGGGSVTFPEAHADLRTNRDSSEVTVSLVRFEDTVELRNADGSIITVRVVCAVDPNQLATTIVEGPPLPATGSSAAPTALLATLVLTSGLVATAAARCRREPGTPHTSTQ